MTLHSKLPAIVSKNKKRVGRGYGSGVGGHTSSRGMKGQKSRSGSKVPLYFEGGNLPLVKRLPMLRGKKRLEVVKPTLELTLNDLQAIQAEKISRETLKLIGILKPQYKKVKIIATGTISKPVTVEGIATSATAKTRIESAGGKVV